MTCPTCRPQKWSCETFRHWHPGCSCPRTRCKPQHEIVAGSSSAVERRDRLLAGLIDLYGTLPLTDQQLAELRDRLLEISETIPPDSPEFYEALATIYDSYNLDIGVLEAQHAIIEVTSDQEARINTQLALGEQLHRMELYTMERRWYEELTQNISPVTRTNTELIATLFDRRAGSLRAQGHMRDAEFALKQAEQWRVVASNLP